MVGILLDNLDMEAILSGDLEMAQLSEPLRNYLNSLVYFSFGSDPPEYNFYHKIRKDDDRNLILSLRNMNAIEINNILRVKSHTESHRKVEEFILKIVHLPSAVLTSLWLSKGKFYVKVLFNHSIYAEMSRTLMENFPQNTDVSMEHLGESGGFNTVLSQINNRSEIMIAQLEQQTRQEELDSKRNPMGDSWVRIMKVPVFYEGLNSVYFLENETYPRGDSLKVTSNLYEARTMNKFGKAIGEKLNHYRIPLEMRVDIFRGGKLTSILVFPEIFRDEIVSILSELFQEQNKWRPTLVRLEKYGDWFQDIFNVI